MSERELQTGHEIFGAPRRVVLGAGASREDVKAWAFRELKLSALTTEHVQSLAEFMLSVLRASPAPRARYGSALANPRVLKPTTRQAVLGAILKSPSARGRWWSLKRILRRGGGLARLDAALERGRLAFANLSEGAVMEARLQEGASGDGARARVREECFEVAKAFEAWQQASGRWDLVRLLREVIEAVDRDEVPELGWEVHYLSSELRPESLVAAAFEALARRGVRFITPVARTKASEAVTFERWHTLDDAAEAVAERAREAPVVVLISDQARAASRARSSVFRAFRAHGAPLFDERDPEALAREEWVKAALLPFRVVASGFEKSAVLSFLATLAPESEPSALRREIEERGVRGGWDAYQGGKLVPLATALGELRETFQLKFPRGRPKAEEIARAHLTWLLPRSGPAFELFRGVWERWLEDLDTVGARERRAPLLWWWRKLEGRLDQAAAPPPATRPATGARLFRANQALPPDLPADAELVILALEAEWERGARVGDDWFSASERDRLQAEFAVRGSPQAEAERLAGLSAWLGHFSSVRWIEIERSADGKELESNLPLLRRVLGDRAPSVHRGRGAHPRWRASYRPAPKLRLSELAPVMLQPMDFRELKATELDHASRCAYYGLAVTRWKLGDPREAGLELRPEVRGQLLHAAARELVRSRDPASGAFGLTPDEALERAWASTRIRGTFERGMVRGVRGKLARALRTFVEKEREYFERVRPESVFLDDPEAEPFSLEFTLSDGAGVRVYGRPDRIDFLASLGGYWVIDYKSSAAQATSGREILGRGTRLQLPFYAHAAEARYGKPALGMQFVVMDTDGRRTAGVLFADSLGPKGAEVVKTTAANHSLIRDVARVEGMARLRAAIVEVLEQMRRGDYSRRPRREKAEAECVSCVSRYVCGFHRREAEAGEGDE